MSNNQNHPHNGSQKADFGPKAFMDAPEELTGNPLDGDAGLPGRKVPTGLLSVITVIALLLGGVGGYLLGNGSQDVSKEGRFDYACALVDRVQQTHRSPEDWGDLKDQGYADVAAAAGLLGGFVPNEDEDDTSSELGSQILRALNRMDTESLSAAVEATDQECQSR